MLIGWSCPMEVENKLNDVKEGIEQREVCLEWGSNICLPTKLLRLN